MNWELRILTRHTQFATHDCPKGSWATHPCVRRAKTTYTTKCSCLSIALIRGVNWAWIEYAIPLEVCAKSIGFRFDFHWKTIWLPLEFSETSIGKCEQRGLPWWRVEVAHLGNWGCISIAVEWPLQKHCFWPSIAVLLIINCSAFQPPIPLLLKALESRLNCTSIEALLIINRGSIAEAKQARLKCA